MGQWRTFLQKLVIYCTIEMPSIDMMALITKHMPQDEWNNLPGLSLLHEICYYRPPDHMTNRSIADLINFITKHSGIDVNSRSANNTTPLHLACGLTGSLSAAKTLLAHPDIDIHLVSNAGYNAFDFACLEGQFEIAQILCSMDNTLASRKNEVRNGKTPLHYAIERMKSHTSHSSYQLVNWIQMKHLELVKYLLSLPNVDVNAQENDGISPLHIACKYKDSLDYEPSRKEAIETLLAHPDIQVNICNASDVTPLHLACRLGSHRSKHKELDAAKALLKAKGIDINAKDIHGNTAMDYARQALDELQDVKILEKAQKLIRLLENYNS